MMYRYLVSWPGAALALALVSVSMAGACGKSGGGEKPAGGVGGRKPRAFPVEVQPVEARDVEYTITGVGSVEAFEEVKVTARVAGVVESVKFVEGAQVKKGQVLAVIEPDRYRLAVAAARASQQKAAAARADAEAGLARRERASQENPGLVPGEELETFRTRVQTAAADAASARVALQKAELELRDAYVRAPIAGVMQTRDVQTGTYAQPGTVLGTLVVRDPLRLRFQVAEPEAARIALGQTVRFSVRGVSEDLTARISHIAEIADEASRMVPITAEIDDARKDALRPGAFAQVSVPVGTSTAAPVIPQIAVRPSERGFLAFVVEDGVAKERVLTLGLRTADGKIEVKSGLAQGEKLVVRGAEALRDGAAVKVAGEDQGAGGPPGKAPAGGGPPASAPAGGQAPASGSGPGAGGAGARP